ncbi:MAG TPA: preprotein translocase subunit SecE [Anaeromyxobacteraceae bacterium]|nr:preprotein translocase subunit SecE [Anaeromyxobacteraceae bacterium]
MAAEKRAGIDPRRMVILFFVLAALALGIFAEKVIGLIFSYARVNDLELFENWNLSTVLGFAMAAAVAIISWRTPKVQTVSLEIAAELKKVTWPTLRETRAATLAVLVASVIAAIILGVFDYVWAAISQRVY